MEALGLIRLHYLFSGGVQGVGFRYHAYYMAGRLHLSGWVKNLSDGTVEMEVQGEESGIDALISSFYQSVSIHIEDMEIKRLPEKEGEVEFRILN